jgi:VanZ family protein
MSGNQTLLRDARALSPALALGWFLAFAYSFAPFDVSLDRIASRASTAEPLDGTYAVSLVLHVLAFVALGLVGWRSRTGHDTRDRSAAAFMARGSFLCILIEVGQLFFASRHAEFVDLLVNVSGLALGMGAGTVLSHTFSGTSTWPLISSRGAGRACLAAWGLVWSAAILSPKTLVALEGWDPAYALLVGDEKSGERAWQGELAYLAFYDRALTSYDMSGPLQMQPSTKDGRIARREAGLVAGYDFSKPHRTIVAPEGALTDPALRINLPDHPKRGEELRALLLGDGPLVATMGGAASLSARLASANAFTIEAWVRPATLQQTGPARIAGISESPYRRNVTLGQEGGAYHFRVRNGFNGENGSRHELVCADAVPLVLHQVVATYERGVSKMFRDGQQICPALDLREPSVMLRLGHGRISAVVTAFLAALSLILAMTMAGAATSLALVLVVGYAWLLLTFAAGLLLSFVPAQSLYIWFGPALVLSWIGLTRRIDGGREPRARR